MHITILNKKINLTKLFITLVIYGLVIALGLSIRSLIIGIQKKQLKLKEIALIKEITLIKDLSQQAFQLNPKCPLDKTKNSYIILGGGRLVLPSEFKEKSSIKNAELVIFHGDDVGQFVEILKKDNYLENLSKEKTIIITPLILWAIKESKHEKSFDKYLENYKRTGDIFNSQGKKYCFIDEFDFVVKKDLSGVNFRIPGESVFTNVKNYALGHLLKTDFKLTGLRNPLGFLDAINFPKPYGFKGSYEDLIEGAKKEYHSKFLSDIIDMDPFGELIPGKILFFPKKEDAYLPSIKVLRLSKNVYLSSAEKPEGPIPSMPVKAKDLNRGYIYIKNK